MIRIQTEPIDYHAATEEVRSHAAGAVCLFLGTVREMTGSQRTIALTYEAHQSLALKSMAKVEEETRSRWPVVEMALIHRTGYLTLGEISVVVVVSSPHRKDAFAACQYAMDRLKEMVPIWKQDHDAAGETSWVHPDASNSSANA